MLLRFFAYHLAALVLLTNIGIPVFTHICHGQGKSWSSVMLPARSCCSKKKAAKPAMPCHAKSQKDKKQGIKTKPCCENHTVLVKTKSDFFNPHPVLTFKALQQNYVAVPPTFAKLGLSAFFTSYFSFQPHVPPLPLHGRSLLVFEQVFRF